MTETTLTQIFPNRWPEGGPVALPDSVAVAEAILERAEPIRSEPDYRDRFYGQMGIVPTTPLQGKPLGQHAVWFWPEIDQPSGSYKSCGASNAALRLPPETCEAVTYSTGNHGLSVAIAGGRLGIKTTVAAPNTLTEVKERRLQQLGALVLTEDPRTGEAHADFEAAEATARSLADQGAALIEPFGNPDVVAGQCKVGFELVEWLTTVGLADREVIIPVTMAGGGHISGIAIPIWQAKQQGRLGNGVWVVGVQPEGANALDQALNRINAGQSPHGLFGAEGPDRGCDALAITEKSLSPMTAAIVNDRRFVAERFVVDKLAIGLALEAVGDQLGEAVEPAAVLPYALAAQYNGPPVTFVLPVSGKNVSSDTLRAYKRVVSQHRANQFRDLSRDYLKRDLTPLDEALKRGR